MIRYDSEVGACRDESTWVVENRHVPTYFKRRHLGCVILYSVSTFPVGVTWVKPKLHWYLSLLFLLSSYNLPISPSRAPRISRLIAIEPGFEPIGYVCIYHAHTAPIVTCRTAIPVNFLIGNTVVVFYFQLYTNRWLRWSFDTLHRIDEAWVLITYHEFSYRDFPPQLLGSCNFLFLLNF